MAHWLTSVQSCSPHASQAVPSTPQFIPLTDVLGKYLSLLVADSPVELLALQAQKVLPRMDDATLDGDGPGRVDIVTSDHADGDACPLALADGFWDLAVGGSRSSGGEHPCSRPSLPLWIPE